MKVVASVAKIADQRSVVHSKEKSIAGNTTGNSYDMTMDGAILNTQSSHVKNSGHVTKVDSIYVVLEDSGSYVEVTTPQTGAFVEATVWGLQIATTISKYSLRI